MLNTLKLLPEPGRLFVVLEIEELHSVLSIVSNFSHIWTASQDKNFLSASADRSVKETI